MEPRSFRNCSNTYLPSPSLLLLVLTCFCCLNSLLLAVLVMPVCTHGGCTPWRMDELQRLGISANSPKSELLNDLFHLSVTTLKSIHSTLFCSCKERNLTMSSCILVNQKDNPSNPITSKLSSDIWTMIDCLRHGTTVPVELGNKAVQNSKPHKPHSPQRPLLQLCSVYTTRNQNSNTQGDLLSDMMVRTDHYAVSV